MGARTITLVGAYGRAATRRDWDSGKDFKIYGGPYCSIRDVSKMREMGYRRVRILCLRTHQVIADICIDMETNTMQDVGVDAI